MFLRKTYFPDRSENRMGDDGDLVRARRIFYENKPRNLYVLLRNRFSWMQKYINPENDVGVEVGCGIGVAKEFLQAKSIILTDYAESPWLDVPMVDAMKTPFNNEEFDFVLCLNMIHHLPNAMKFFREMERILKPNGVLLVQEVNSSFVMRLALRLMRKEGYSFEVDVFDEAIILSDPASPWSGNNAIGELLFNDHNKFQSKVPFFRIEQDDYSECFLFLNSGGVTAKTISVPLPSWGIRLIELLDRVCVWLAPNFFAMQRSIALRKV